MVCERRFASAPMDDGFTARLEQSLGRTLARQKPGRKPKAR